MRPVEIGKVTLWMESPEAGRYLAPILIVPGLFHSSICLRGMTSMLAHRGWEVYLLPRSPDDASGGASGIPADQSWAEAVDAVATARSRIGEEVIILAADIGASLTLSALPSMKAPLALALFAPAAPQHLGEALSRSLGFFARRRFRSHSGSVAPPPALAEAAYQSSDISNEPHRLLDEMIGGQPFAAPANHPFPFVVNGLADGLIPPPLLSD